MQVQVQGQYCISMVGDASTCNDFGGDLCWHRLPRGTRDTPGAARCRLPRFERGVRYAVGNASGFISACRAERYEYML